MKILTPLLLLFNILSNAQSNATFDERYYDHWESIDIHKSKLEIIIYKNKKTTRIIELDFDAHCEYLSANLLYPTVYVHKRINGTMAVETINMINLDLIDSEYVLTKKDELLRITKKDTVVLRRRYPTK